MGNSYVSSVWDMPSGDSVSVVVAVYNMEAYLRTCMEALLSQTHREIEVVLVDDGSIDASGAICDAYAAEDARVKVVHQANAGQSAARNAGIATARGDWLCCVDPDDVVASSYVERLLAAARACGAPAVGCLTEVFYENELPECSSNGDEGIIILSGVEAACEILSEGLSSTSPCGKLAPLAAWRELRFPEGRRFEDLAVIWRFFESAPKVALIRDRIYFYRKHAGSTSAVDAASRESIAEYITSIEQVLSETSLSSNAVALKRPAAFRAALECCRAYEMCALSKCIEEQDRLRFESYVKKCVAECMPKAIFATRAPIKQRIRILLFTISPAFSLRLLGMHKKGY